MKKVLFFLLIFLAFVYGNAQIVNPVKWTSNVEKLSETEFNLVMQGKIDDEWHVYSQFTPENGPLPAEFAFENEKGNYELVGKVKESPYKKQYNEVFEVDEYYFEKKVTFTQKVKILNAKISSIKAKIDYQVCKQACINDNMEFTFAIPTIKETAIVPAVDTVSKTDTLLTNKNEIKEASKSLVVVEAPKKEDQKGLWTIFFLAFLAGFAALLTPCVFPMIPMTMSFFTKQSKNKAEGKRNAVLYGLSIIIIYVILGTLVTAIFGSDALNALSTNVWFNLIFFLLLIFFASSFLGAFEIVLPNSWANKVDRQADRGGLVGILFMALALAIVSFSCTGPIIGTLLVEGASKGGLAPIVGMVGFSLALALPFMLFAMFPGWINSLPKSGGWLNTVKVSLGFLELALAFKFLSKADLVTQSHLLPREIFLAIWIAVFGAWALYLFGKISLPHDGQLSHISVGRLFMALLVTSFTFYLIPGLWGAPLKVLSGYTPPLYDSESPDGVGRSSTIYDTGEKLPENAKQISNGLITFLDYEAGMAYAKKLNKPVLLDFTGHGCENCREMEVYVWSDKEVLNILKNDVVLISLYVDEKKELPEKEKYVSKQTGKEIETVGNKWSDFQITRYKTNTQPQYLILDLEGNTISEGSTSYDLDVKKYKAWLLNGINKFK
jgi:thiol:disulfide interchange protein DsbD